MTYQHELEEYMKLRELILLDNEFFSLLTFGEKIAVEETAKDENLNEFGNELLNQAFQKGLKVFFKEKPLYKDIDPKKLGIVLKKIREVKGFSKVQLASVIGFDRTYITRAENEKHVSSLKYFYRFSVVTNTTVDQILNLI